MRGRGHAEDSGMTIRIRYHILNARLAAGAVSPGAGRGGGVDQAYGGWRIVSQFEFQQRVVSGRSSDPPERRHRAKTLRDEV